MSEVSPLNKLNELPAKDWMKFTKTWFIHNPPPRKKGEKLHPAKYPEKMISEFVSFFTKSGQLVFDPFLGTGSTLVACHQTKRNGVGIELQQKYAEIAQERLKNMESQLKFDNASCGQNCKQLVIKGNSSKVQEHWQHYNLPKIDFLITSPPYGPMLNKKGIISRDREDKGLDVSYSEDNDDLGNSETYQEFLNRLTEVFLNVKPLLKEGAYLVVILQNYMEKKEYRPLAWDVGKELAKHYLFRGERIWCQDNKTLYPYGYRFSFVPNVHHHYCLIFRNVEEC